ncbi:hypothetical protein [Pseudomonas fluorescens]|uniref:hypothetical protein n=1 Tax=Pseudomonas fluorescens TaxID=294 RepID=UPI001CA61459|nr:hypothetical protein [Pseudomonas fluorescens]MBY8933101.1 hypothetical protein [Pseudomonas fluorescens]
MTVYKKLTPAQQSRLDYQKIRLAAPKMDAFPPEIHPDNPLLPDQPGDGKNQVHRSIQGLPLKINIPRFSEADATPAVDGYIELMWNGKRLPGTRFTYTTPIDPNLLLIPMVLPANLTDKEGEHELSYFLTQGGNVATVTPVPINVDSTPPLTETEVIVPAEVDRDGITKKYLDDIGHVLIRVQEYQLHMLNDKVECFIGRSSALATLIGTVDRTELTLPLEFKLTAAMLDDEEGVRAIYWKVTDRKGNASLESPYKRLNVTLTDPPADLKPLDIPLYIDSLIDLADAQEPVGVGIKDEYTHFLPGDQLEVTWDGLLQPAVTIPGFPFYVDVPFRNVFNNNAGLKTVTASYQIKRGGAAHPLNPVELNNISVDLRKPGTPIDPDKPGNPNPDLPTLSVQGASGGTPDQLREGDNVGPVVVTATLYTGAKENDQIQLYWKGEPVSEEDGGVVKIGTPLPADLRFTVLWSVFDDAGNGNPIKTHYVISHLVNDNVDVSLATDVDVLIRPGVVPVVRFQHLDEDFGLLNCRSLRPDTVAGTVVEVLVLGGEPQLEGQELTFTYQGYIDNGSTIKPGTEAKVKHIPTSQEAAAGFIVRIPYDPAVLATENAWGGIIYSAVIDGHDTPSVEHVVRVYMKDPGGGPCPLR